MAELGKIKIVNEVVSIIAGIAATEVEGVFAMSGGIGEGISSILGRKNLSKGVKIEMSEEESCKVDIYLVVEYGCKIPEVALNVQESIIKAITEMTGLDVTGVDIFIQGINMKKPELPEELEEPVIEVEVE